MHSKLFKTILFILIIVLFLTSYQYYTSVKNNIYNEFQANFTLHSSEFKTLIEQRMLAYEQVLHGTRGLFSASNFVNRKDFKAYVDSLMLDKIFPGIQGVGYSVIVPKNSKDEFIQKIRNEGFFSFNITPSTPRDFYTAILYLEPFDFRNQKAFGYDMFSNPNRKIAMERARDTSMVINSPKVTLIQEDENDIQAGFLMYLPIFQRDTNNTTVQQRQKHILGWVYSLFRVTNLMQELTKNENKNFDIELYDNGIISQQNLMYDSYKNNGNSLFQNIIGIRIGGRDWSVVVKSTPKFEESLDYSKAQLILFFTFIFNIFLMYIILQLINNEKYAENKAKEMNKELIIKKYQLTNLNTTLETRVKEKTYELQTTNSLLAEHIKSLECLNTKLIKAKEEAQQAAQARSNFISSISHELRTPLNSIINFTDQTIEDFDDMLEDKELQADTRNFLQRVMINSRHLLQLINDLLEFTKAEAGKINYSMEQNDINTILKTAYNNTNSLLNGTNIQFNLNIASQELIATVDSRRFLQIILNLLSNAIKFTHEGFVELRSFTEDNFIIIEIEDTGKGIPLEKQKLIFEPFMQVQSTDNGTGLGLGLAKKMCDDMDIKITFSSTQGRGTIFRLILQKFKE